MKKLILAVAFVFATGSMMNANSSNEEVISTTVEVVEDFGCASDCVQSAKERAEFLAFILDADVVDVYMVLYTDCYYENC